MSVDLSALDRPSLYFRYLIERGGLARYGTPFWLTPERQARIDMELEVIEGAGFSSTFVMLADVMNYCRREKIPVGPGRGSVGGSFVCYLAGIHDVDSIEYELLFERFMNPSRVSFPDVDIDVSQRHRPKVLQYIVDTYTRDDQVVLQIGAFVRAGGRAVVDLMATAMAQKNPDAWATATTLKKCFPEKGSITGGQKIARELHAWLYEDKGHGDKSRFIEIAEQAGWLPILLKLDGMFTHLGKHAAGVVILRKDDLPLIPKIEVTNTEGVRTTVTAYDMYSLDDLGYLKWDWLGLRTLDVITDAARFEGGTGERAELIELWKNHRDDPGPYELLCAADTVGIFQMETDGYRRTLRTMQPTCFDDLVALGALYRPGALDFKREDGKNMVEIFIDRMHGREPVTYPHPDLREILEPTYGIILYQEQQMAIARKLAGFSLAEADMLRKAIGKKLGAEMTRLMTMFREGCAARGVEEAVIERVAENIEAAARYSWNKSHAVFYGMITWWTTWFKDKRVGFYCAEINSWEEKKDKQANVISEARQHVEFRPPDVNVAIDRFTVDSDRRIVFGLNGIKGMGDSYRNALLVERMMGGDFKDFEDFCNRVGGSVPNNIKLALIKCGAFDTIDSRAKLLATIPTPTPQKPDKTSTVAEFIDGNRPEKRKKPRPLPTDITDYAFPSDTQMAAGELESMGYYISTTPMKHLTAALARHSANVIGGEIEKVNVKQDKNTNSYGVLNIVKPDLSKATVMIFASDWGTFANRCTAGAQLLFRGREDGGKFLAQACWPPDDVRHHKKVRVQRGDEQARTEDFDGDMATLQALERAGYHVRLL